MISYLILSFIVHWNMQQTSTLEPVFRVLFAMLAYAARTVAPNTNKLRHLPLSKYGQMHTAGLASLFGDFVFANVLTILKMLFLARCCCHQAPTPSLVQIWGEVRICAKFLFALLHLHTPAVFFSYTRWLNTFSSKQWIFLKHQRAQTAVLILCHSGWI